MKLVAVAVLLAASGCTPSRAREPAPEPAAPRVVAVAPSRSAWRPPPSPALGMSCGELALYRRGLAAAGKGERHPEVLQTEARLAACADRTPGAEACQAALTELERLVGEGKLDRHPDVIVARAKVELCRETFGDGGVPPAGPPDAAECDALRARRASLVAAGKGERHPLILAVDARLRQCP